MISHRARFLNWIVAFVFGVCLTFGFQAKNYGEVLLTNPVTYILPVVMTVLFGFMIKYIWQKWDLILSKKAMQVRTQEDNVSFKKAFLTAFLIISVLYLIVFLGVYPGFFCYDAQDELVETIARTFSNQHPMLHVLSMGGIVQAFHKLTGDYNIAIAAFILFGMLITSGVYGFLVAYLRTNGLGKRGALIFTLYLGLFPVLVMLALCSTKDGVFGAFLILTVLYLLKMIKNPQDFFSKKKEVIIFVISATLMMLLRSNGIYAFIVFLPIAVFAFWKTLGLRKYFKQFLVVGVIAVIAFFVINKGMLHAVNASDIGHREILSVPIQQITRVYCYDPDSLSQDEKNSILKYLPDETLKRYEPKAADVVKIDFNEAAFSESPSDFIKLWMSLMTKHPKAYVDAWVMTSYGMWYPGAIMDNYKGHDVYTHSYEETSYFAFETEPPGERDSKIPVINDIYRWFSLDSTIQKIPVINMLFSPGFMFFVFIFVLGFMISYGRGRLAIAFLIPFLTLLTNFIGPLSLVRYVFYLWVIIPIMFFEVTKAENVKAVRKERMEK
ncbi:MAG: DUF6020 family protein [Lachnospiraceae bacterium]|nr:DUF6020 family protein [Lachnospiraceae bacterium]